MNKNILPKTIYQKRQQQVLTQMLPNSIAIIFAGTQKNISADNDFLFVQANNMAYLSGFYEQNSALVLIKAKNSTAVQLFCQEKDFSKQLWDGYIYGIEDAKKYFNADKYFNYSRVHEKVINAYSELKLEHIYYDFNDSGIATKTIPEYLHSINLKLRKNTNPPSSLQNLGLILAKNRLIKDATEIELMRKAATISAQAHILAMQKVKQCGYEYQLQAILEGHFIDSGGAKAYNSIVASGENACTLHYNDNSAQLNKKDLVLIDAGAIYRNYCGDITRTFPINGKFSSEQACIYNLVLDAQLQAIQQCQIGNNYYDPHRKAVSVIEQGLEDLGILGDYSVRDFFPHGTGHWIGMDVHDISPYSSGNQEIKFVAGMCLTVEPGIYIPKTMTKLSSKYHTIGIRIEDDILITDKGPKVLTKLVPKTIAEIEELIGQVSKK